MHRLLQSPDNNRKHNSYSKNGKHNNKRKDRSFKNRTRARHYSTANHASNDEASMTISQSDTIASINRNVHLPKNKSFNNNSKRDSSSNRVGYHFTSNSGITNGMSKGRQQSRDQVMHNNNSYNVENSVSAVSVISEKSESNLDDSRRQSLSNQNNNNSNINININGSGNNKSINIVDVKDGNDSVKPNFNRPTSTPAGGGSMNSQNDIDITFLRYDSYRNIDDKNKPSSKMINDRYHFVMFV